MIRARTILAAAVLGALPAAAQTPPVNRAALTAQRARLTPQVARAPRSPLLCTLGDVERQLGENAAALAHYREGVQRLPGGVVATPAQEAAARRTEFQCRHGLARTLEATSVREAAAEIERAWGSSRGQRLPADFRAWSTGVFRRALSGADCVTNRDDDVRAVVTEVSVLRHLADGDDPGLRACLGAVRARLTRVRQGHAAPTAAPTPPFRQGAEGWTAIDAQTGWRMGDAGVVLARVDGANARYITLDGTAGEGGTQLTARWLALGSQNLLAVVLAVTTSGEDLGPRERPTIDRRVEVLDDQLRLVGSYTTAYGDPSAGHPAQPALPNVTGAWPLRVEAETLVIGRTRLVLRDGALVAAPPAAPAAATATPAR
jgi:hypothetical protein